MRHYVMLSGIIGGIIGSILTGLLVAPVTARSDKFGEIECTHLAVVDAKGKERIILSTNIPDGYDDRNIAEDMRVRIVGNESLALVVAQGKGLESAELSTNVYGTPRVAATDKDGSAWVSLSTDENGGVVHAAGNDGQSVLLRIIEQGGQVAVFKGPTSPGAVLHVDEHGGYVAAYDSLGKIGARLGVTEHGGHVQVTDKGKGKATMGINEYGNGAISTWDKNGNRQ